MVLRWGPTTLGWSNDLRHFHQAVGRRKGRPLKDPVLLKMRGGYMVEKKSELVESYQKYWCIYISIAGLVLPKLLFTTSNFLLQRTIPIQEICFGKFFLTPTNMIISTPPKVAQKWLPFLSVDAPAVRSADEDQLLYWQLFGGDTQEWSDRPGDDCQVAGSWLVKVH